MYSCPGSAWPRLLAPSPPLDYSAAQPHLFTPPHLHFTSLTSAPPTDIETPRLQAAITMSSSKRNPEKQAKNEYIPYFIAKKPFYIDDDTEGDYRTSLPNSSSTYTLTFH